MYPILAYPYKIKKQPIYSLIYFVKENNTYTIPVNETGMFILSLCNGNNTIEDIIFKTCNRYGEKIESVSKLVKDFINYSLKIGTVSLSKEKKSINVNFKGDGLYWIANMVVLELTHKCNLKCIHCYLDAGQNTTLSEDLLKKYVMKLLM